MYGFTSQDEGARFLEGLGFEVGIGKHGMNHICTAREGYSKPDIAFVTTNGELCLIDEERAEFKGSFEKIKDALKRYKG